MLEYNFFVILWLCIRRENLVVFGKRCKIIIFLFYFSIAGFDKLESEREIQEAIPRELPMCRGLFCENLVIVLLLDCSGVDCNSMFLTTVIGAASDVLCSLPDLLVNVVTH